MLALDPVEGPERSWAWFAEGPDEGGVVLGTSQKRVRRIRLSS
jgi:hypothetical protein